MPTLEEQIAAARLEALDSLGAVSDTAALEEWNSKYLGKKGQMTGLFRGVGALPAKERAKAGQTVNAAKQELEEAYAAAKKRIVSHERTRQLQSEAVDVTLPGRPVHAGHLHVITQTTRDILR